METDILAGLAVAAAYVIWLIVMPWWTCSSCGGSQVRTGRRGAHGRCLRCHGAGRYPRLGVRILMPGRARNMRDGQKGTFY